MSQPLVSIVVPCFNYGRFLGDCLSAALNQRNYSNVEVIVIDDASTDDTPSVIKRFSDPRLIAVRHEKNQGHVITINEGLAMAKGKYVCRIDADDRHRPDFLEQTIPYLEKDPSLGAVYGEVNLIDEHGAVTTPAPTSVATLARNIYLDLLGENFICAPTLIARNELWKQALPILSGLTHSDWYLNLQMARRAPFLHRPVTLAEYRVHSRNLHTQLVMNKGEEPTTFRILDLLYSTVESDAQLEWRKKKIRRGVYGKQYRSLVLKYYGAGYFADAERCFREGLKLSPGLFATPALARVGAALLMGVERYERLKQRLKRR